MTPEQLQLAVIKGSLAECTASQQKNVAKCAAEIKATIGKFEAIEQGVGVFGMALAGAQMAVDAQK